MLRETASRICNAPCLLDSVPSFSLGKPFHMVRRRPNKMSSCPGQPKRNRSIMTLQGKKIELFLVDGHPSGLVTCSPSNSPIKAYRLHVRNACSTIAKSQIKAEAEVVASCKLHIDLAGQQFLHDFTDTWQFQPECY